eukprot:3935086-Rhodomonas_salina.1
MSGTNTAYGAISLRDPTRCSVSPAISLRARSAMSGTDLAYAMNGIDLAYVALKPSSPFLPGSVSAIGLRASYAMSGTEIAYPVRCP